MIPRGLLLAALLALGGCKGEGTRVLLTVRFPTLELDSLRIAARSGSRAFPTARRPDPAVGILTDPQSVALLLPDEIAGQQLELVVEGLRLEAVRASVGTSTVPVRGESVAAEVWLSPPPIDGGGDLPRDLGPADRLRAERRDLGQSDLPRDARRDGTLCKPAAFIACQGSTLSRCSPAGDAILTEECAPFACNASAGRCNDCDPAAVPSCAGSDRVTCSAAGLKSSTPCPLGCAAGACCADQDADQVSTCGGDCDDGDPDAHPGQLGFFAIPSKGTGSYDFDCDQVVELELAALEGCTRVGAGCIGHGWQTTVPGCGGSGTFVTCKPSGRSMCSHDTGQATQRCR